MLPNPYTPGRPAQVLGGRTRERARIASLLERVETLGEYAGPLHVFHAPRGLGKTSLLRSAEREAASRGFATVWVSATRRGNVAAELTHALRTSLERLDSIGSRDLAAFGLHLSKVELQLGVPGAGVRASVERSRDGGTAPEPVTPAEAPVSGLESVLRDSAALVRGSGGAGLALFVDEVHAADRAGLGVVLNALQNLDGASSAAPLAAMFAGLPNTPEVIIDAATFGERSQWLPLDRLDDDDSAVALVRPAADAGVDWDHAARRRVVSDAAGYPYFLQLLGSTTWDVAAPDPGAVLELDHVRAGYRDAREQLGSLFRARWSKASPGQQEFLVAMVELMLEHGTDDVERAGVARRLGRTTREISVPRDRLIAQDVIEPTGRGLLRFTMPGFAGFVAEEAGIDGAERLQAPARFPEL
ncbi:AAA family ATPase [Nocardioides flavescens]|uniref:AAA family ATPase n=1 Tax=Nocardioides flavescens TaxID=2691959 RepID=A0A6L7EYK0_9ACTN|nr:AAA family ATPase [Nocardioides flavescens]